MITAYTARKTGRLFIRSNGSEQSTALPAITAYFGCILVAIAPKTAQESRVAAATRQLELAVEDKGERIAIPEARKQIALYLKGFRGASTLRARINAAGSLKEVKEALKHAAEDLSADL